MKTTEMLTQKPYTGKFSMTGNTLKLIACIIMLIDHTAVSLLYIYGYNGISIEIYDLYQLMRSVGRIAFPIFIFLLIEGFGHTHSVKKYAFNLFLFSIISEIPFDLALFNTIFEPNRQNVFFTLLLGVLAMASFEYVLKIKNLPKPLAYLFCAVCAAFFAAAAYFLGTDYGEYGVIAICAAYFLRRIRTAGTFLSCTVLRVLDASEITAFFALIPITLYNGRRGKGNKYFFYFFYPAHLILLYALRVIIIM